MNKCAVVLWILMGLGVASAFASPLDRQVEFNIPAQPLSAALIQFSNQADVQVITRATDVSGAQTRGVQGRMSVNAALKQLLSETKFSYLAVGDNTVEISAGTLQAARAELDGQDGLHLAQAATASSAGDTADVKQSSPAERLEEIVVDIPEILVVGSKSLNMDIVRTQNAAQPYVVFDRESLERSGAANLEEFFRRNLTASTDAETLSQSNALRSGSRINLRGLGADETLILIDGRRTAGVSGNGELLQPDLNGIPLTAIERIEVLPATASGIYGGGATGGVINVVLRRDYTGVDARLTYDNTFDTDSRTRRLDLTGGTTFEGGRTTLLFSAAYSDANSLLVKDRDFARRRVETIQDHNPGFFRDAVVPPLGATTNICSAIDFFGSFTCGGAPLTLKGSNIPVGAAMTSVPTGYAGVSSDQGVGFITNAGEYNLEIPDTTENTGGGRALLNSPRLKSVMTTVRREFTPWLQAFVEAGASQNVGSFEGLSATAASSGFALPAASPANPFNEDILISTPLRGAQSATRTAMKNYRAAAGIIVKLPAEWRAESDYTWSRSQFSAAGLSALDEDAATGATAAIRNGETSSGAADFDVFRDTAVNPVNFGRFLLSPERIDPSDSTLEDMTVRTSGPLPWALSGGAPTLSMLLEHREERLDDSSTAFSAAFTARTLYPHRSQRVDSAYVEALIPLVSARNALAAVKLLELQIAARHDRYRTVGADAVPADENGVPLAPIVRKTNEVQSTDPTVGVRFKPIEDLMLRASYGTGFLPPAVDQLVALAPFPLDLSVFPGGVIDPLRNGEAVGEVLLSFGGNSALSPEQSESRSAGVVFTPRFVPGLRMSVDWTRIEKSDAITLAIPTFSPEEFNLLIASAPENITREASSGGLPGRITAIRGGLVNFNSARVEAYDFGLDYSFDTSRWGNFSLGTRATRLAHSEQQLTPTDSSAEIVGTLAALPWRANATLSWEYRNWTVAWSSRWFHSYFLNDEHVLDINQGSATIPSQVYHDLFVRRRFDVVPGFLAGAFSHTEVRLGVRNVFNTKPPIDVKTSFDGYSPLGDPRLASYYVSLSKSFAGK